MCGEGGRDPVVVALEEIDAADLVTGDPAAVGGFQCIEPDGPVRVGGAGREGHDHREARVGETEVALVEGAWGGRDRVQPDYETIHEALPLYGGRPPEVLAAMLEACGFGEITVEPLVDAALWGGVVRDDRYLITAVRI